MLCAIGAVVRFVILSRAVIEIIKCRRMSVLRGLWPPAGRRIGLKFLLPRAGMYVCMYMFMYVCMYAVLKLLLWVRSPYAKV